MADGGDARLPNVFDDIWAAYDFIEKTEEPSNSTIVQNKVKGAIKQCEQAIQMINDLELFSSNEELQEVATGEIRYLIVPAMLGYFTLKSMSDERLEIVRKAQTYYEHFLKLCKQYGVHQTTEESAAGDVRTRKIERYKKQKETERKLNELYETVQQSHVDEEVKRDYYTTLLTRWINVSLEEIECTRSEIPILEHMAKMKSGGPTNRPTDPVKKARTAPQTFILTKSLLEAQVFGAGYPSIPTYTIEQFAENQIKQGNFPPPGASFQSEPSADEVEKQDLEKEENIEGDDPETLQKARDWDDWKDDHRRGWGNRQNMG